MPSTKALAYRIVMKKLVLYNYSVWGLLSDKPVRCLSALSEYLRGHSEKDIARRGLQKAERESPRDSSGG